MEIVQVHPEDSLAREAITRVLNQNHDGKIRQASLDFYRHDYRRFISKKTCGGEIIFIVGILDRMPVALSLCSILRKEGRAINSLTVVHKDNRKLRIGTKALSAKLLILRWLYPWISFSSYVGKKNVKAVSMCLSSGLSISGEGRRQRDGKKSTEFFVLSLEGK